jgi:hypothetical protein
MELELKDIPDYGDHMTLKEFIKAVKEGCLTDYDGHGYYATAMHMSNILVLPSHITGKTSELDWETGKIKIVKVEKKINKNFSHIIWFNK